MKRFLLILPMLSVSACVSGQSGNLDAYCTASEAAIKAHAAALSVTQDVTVLRTGDLVVRQRDAACG